MFEGISFRFRVLICFSVFSPGGQRYDLATRRVLLRLKTKMFVFVVFVCLWFCGVYARRANIQFLYAEELELLGPGNLESVASLDPRFYENFDSLGSHRFPCETLVFLVMYLISHDFSFFAVAVFFLYRCLCF